jgi:hypothetical protein
VAEPWSIAKSRHVCAGCGKEFAEKRSFFSCLLDGPEGFERRDFCPGCWEVRAPGEVFCFWRTRRPAEEARRVVDTGLMLEFFDRLKGAEADDKKVFRFVLALYLMRRKELKLLEIAREGETEKLVFRRKSDGEKVDVANPGLSEEEIQGASSQLSELLNAGLAEQAD